MSLHCFAWVMPHPNQLLRNLGFYCDQLLILYFFMQPIKVYNDASYLTFCFRRSCLRFTLRYFAE